MLPPVQGNEVPTQAQAKVTWAKLYCVLLSADKRPKVGSFVTLLLFSSFEQRILSLVNGLVDLGVLDVELGCDEAQNTEHSLTVDLDVVEDGLHVAVGNTNSCSW